MNEVRSGIWPGSADTHRRVVHVAAVIAAVAALLVFLVGLWAEDPPIMKAAIGPGLAAVFMMIQSVLRLEHAGVALFASSALIAALAYREGGPMVAPLSVALIVITALGAMLIDRHRLFAVVVPAVILLALPHTWDLTTTEAWRVGLVNAAAFSVAAVVFIAIRTQISVYSDRYRTLFDESPAAIMEENWVAAIQHLESEYDGKPERIEKFLMAYPSVLREAVSKARVVRANRAASELLEAPSTESLLGYRDGNRVRDINVEAWASILGALYRRERHYGIDMATVTRQGRHIWVQVRGVDVDPANPGSTIYVGLADVTHNHERSDAMAELVQAKNDFIARVSHELRTPLTAVVGLAAELDAGDDLGPDERKELTRLLSGQAHEVAGIVEDLLVAARAEMGTMTVERTVVDLDREVASTVEGLGTPIRGIEGPLPTVMADAARVRQIVRNLLTNAERYGGPNISVRGGAQGRSSWLEVRDDGPGVPDDLAEKIFEPYTGAGERASQSVGIGLSVSRQLAELMGGSLTYVRDGGETVFRLELPSASMAPEASHASQGVEG